MNDAFFETLRGTLPSLTACDGIRLEDFEVLVHAPGFEDRTFAIVQRLHQVAPTSAAVLLDYRPQNPGNRLSDVRTGLVSGGVRISDDDILAYDRFDPADFESRLLNRLRALNALRVLLDISTMSKLEIMLVLHMCCQHDIDIRVFYAEAESYAPTQDQFVEAREANKVHQPSLQIFTGIHGVVRVDSLASVAMQGQPTAAIVFMSFNDALTQSLLNTVYPSRLFLINGRPPVLGWREEATAWIHDQVRREWPEDNPVHGPNDRGIELPKRAVSTLDYREATGVVLHLYWQLSSTHRILLAPAGSKLQAIGCYLAKALHPDIHIEYPSPDGFFPNYSTGIGKSWLLEIGNLKRLISEISTLERREFLEIPVD